MSHPSEQSFFVVSPGETEVVRWHFPWNSTWRSRWTMACTFKVKFGCPQFFGTKRTLSQIFSDLLKPELLNPICCTPKWTEVHRFWTPTQKALLGQERASYKQWVRLYLSKQQTVSSGSCTSSADDLITQDLCNADKTCSHWQPHSESFVCAVCLSLCLSFVCLLICYFLFVVGVLFVCLFWFDLVFLLLYVLFVC